MLNLSEFNVIAKEQNDFYYKFTVEKNETPYFCTQCGWMKPMFGESKLFPEDNGKEFKPHQIKERVVTDISMHNKAVKLVIRHKRYRCPDCDGTFYEILDSVDRGGKVTKRLVEHMKLLALKRPFTQIADEYGISHTSVRRYFEEYVIEQEKHRELIAPRVLGIDEAHLNRVMRGVFTDNENRMILEITSDNLKRTVKQTIQRMEGWKNIEVVTIDMHSGYKYAVNELVPKAFVVIDKFHVIQYATNALDDVRIAVKKSLPKPEQRILTHDRWVLLKNKEDLKPHEIEKRDIWFKHFPVLAKAYWLKEGIRDIYNHSKDRYEAFQRFYAWETSIPKEFKEFKEIQKTFNNCKQEIFNYFLQPYTNAYTESVNNIIKSVEKAGKGYSFDVLRAKVLYGTKATIKKPKFEKDMKFTSFENIHYRPDGRMEPIYVDGDEPKLVTVGTDITTLSELFERGEF